MGGGSPSQPSLMERASLPQFGWLATEVLQIEGAAEVESGIWPALQQELLSSSSIPLETAFKVNKSLVCNILIYFFNFVINYKNVNYPHIIKCLCF